MGIAVNFDTGRDTGLRPFASLHQASFVGLVFAALMAGEALGFLALGTGRAGLNVALSCVVLSSLLAIASAWVTFRRSLGVTAMFWFLFAVVLTVLFAPTALQAYDSMSGQRTVADSTWRLLYCLYGAPVLMMLFLPDAYRQERLKSEVFLDLFQVTIVVGLVYATFFFAPVQSMLPTDAFLRNLNLSNAQSLILLLAALVRLQFARVAATRDLLVRLTFFLLVCAVVTLIGDWIDLHHYTAAAAWFNLGWTIPEMVAGLIAVTWTTSPSAEDRPDAPKFLNFLVANLILVTMLCCINLLMDGWKQVYGSFLADGAIAASLLAFTLRLALTQFHQHEEISQRKAAQLQLTASHHKIGRLLDDARTQTAEITQISELGSLLHACASRDEIFRLIPPRLRQLFPGASGCVAMISPSGKRVESAAEWGVDCPTGQIFSPEECWALRRGCAHARFGRGSTVQCSHLRGDGPSVCVPLIANGETIGTLTIQNDDRPAVSDAETDVESNEFTRRRELAATIAENIALAVANVDLREKLRLQAVRDPLTGLYNRRYMQEFLDRELHSARRKHRPLSVMMLDLDHFKRYNDNYGHAAGDKALAMVGEVLSRSMRADDVACRYGGEEFALILPECSLLQANTRAEEIRGRIEASLADPDGRTAGDLSVSIGVAAFDETTDRVDLLLKFADDALYLAKRAGRNRVSTARPAVALPEELATESALATEPNPVTIV